MSTPLVNNQQGRVSHLMHLQRLLLDPVVITSQKLLGSDFAGIAFLRYVTTNATVLSSEPIARRWSIASDGCASNSSSILMGPCSNDGSESMDLSQRQQYHDNKTRSTDLTTSNSSSGKQYDTEDDVWQKAVRSAADASINLEGVAALMLTSGSTGAAKAVCLGHEQIMTACTGKLCHMPLPSGAVVLNWIGLDHVGSLIELHVTAMVAGCDQVHVPTTAVVADPLILLRLLSEHGVARTFAPNFLLARLQKVLEAVPEQDVLGINLRKLLYLISGGEPNSVDTCVKLSGHLQALGAPSAHTITPGFGMTETCAGSIYSRQCPTVDLQTGTEFAALGSCLPGIEMRVRDENLEVRGPIVSSRYFNDVDATRRAFTEDGWFRTGDKATIDASHNLRLTGRSKDLIIINGIKYLPHELENAIHQAKIIGLAPSSVVCFAYRPMGASTETVQIIYQRQYEASDTGARIRSLQEIIRIVVSFAGVRPRVLPLGPDRVERSTLGKLSRHKIKESLLKGEYEEEVDIDAQMLRTYQEGRSDGPTNYTERTLLLVLDELQLSAPEMDIDTPILDLGITSVDLIRIKRAAETALGIKDIPMLIIMNSTTIRSLSTAIESLRNSSHVAPYNPLVTLQPNGNKTPLFLVHPGIGEMLVFLGLVQYFPGRPIYAMRARGLNEGETPFESLKEVIRTYHRALKIAQPEGPYAIAGYSYGSMLAFEIAKVLESNGDRVQFLGSFNLPPHIKTRMRRLDWTAGLVHIAHFCSIITEPRSEELLQELRRLEHPEQVARLLAESDSQRCEELALTQASLHNWTDVS